MEDYVRGWNVFLKKRYKEEAELINLNDFLQTIGLSENFRLGFEDFKNILGKYLKFRKLSMEQFNKSIDTFFEKKVKVEK